MSRVCEAIEGEFEVFQTRDLSDVTLDYLFLDGSHFKFHAGNASEPVLAAWGITTDGRPVLVGLTPSDSESFDAWAEFLRDLSARGLTPPLLVISDGAPGLIGPVRWCSRSRFANVVSSTAAATRQGAPLCSG